MQRTDFVNELDLAPVSTPRNIADEYNAVADKIESEFGAVCHRRHSFKDRHDAELSLARIRSTYRAMCNGWRDQQRADRRQRNSTHRGSKWRAVSNAFPSTT